MHCQVQIAAAGFLKRVSKRILTEARKNSDFYFCHQQVFKKSLTPSAKVLI
jgi:hypothetical protein